MKNKMIAVLAAAVKLNRHNITNEQEVLVTNQELKINDIKISLND